VSSPRSGESAGSLRAKIRIPVSDHTAFSSTVTEEKLLRETRSRRRAAISWISLEGRDTAFRPDQPRPEKREETYVRADIIESPADSSAARSRPPTVLHLNPCA